MCIYIYIHAHIHIYKNSLYIVHANKYGYITFLILVVQISSNFNLFFEYYKFD